MHVIARRTLKEFWEKHADARGALEAWLAHVERADWKSPTEVKADYRDADILPDSRVVFDIKGNQYRLVVKIRYTSGVVFIRFIGAHQAYDKIDAGWI